MVTRRKGPDGIPPGWDKPPNLVRINKCCASCKDGKAVVREGEPLIECNRYMMLLDQVRALTLVCDDWR